MLTEIITIGDEILIGQIVDTNSAWIAQQLNLNGIHVKQITSVSDQREHILNALAEAHQRADVILITGGLGPTKDDITKSTLCDYFNTNLVFDEEVYKNVEAFFRRYNREVTLTNRKQAEIPKNCIPLQNSVGTASGMWFEHQEKIYVSMPGVPYEMKELMSAEVLPRLRNKFHFPAIVHKTILTNGIGESSLSDLIELWEASLSQHSIKLAYLPQPGKVRLRLSSTGKDKKTLEQLIDDKVAEVMPLIEKFVVGFEEYGKEPEGLEHIVGKELQATGKTLSLAESCTGGYISHLITSVAGSSSYYKGTIISYDNAIKSLEFGISPELIANHGAVSKEVVEAMAIAINRKFASNYALATSGIAGPGGGSMEKPVGTVWVAMAGPNGVTSKKFTYGGDRLRNIQMAAQSALSMLYHELHNLENK